MRAPTLADACAALGCLDDDLAFVLADLVARLPPDGRPLPHLGMSTRSPTATIAGNGAHRLAGMGEAVGDDGGRRHVRAFADVVAVVTMVEGGAKVVPMMRREGWSAVGDMGDLARLAGDAWLDAEEAGRRDDASSDPALAGMAALVADVATIEAPRRCMAAGVELALDAANPARAMLVGMGTDEKDLAIAVLRRAADALGPRPGWRHRGGVHVRLGSAWERGRTMLWGVPAGRTGSAVLRAGAASARRAAIDRVVAGLAGEQGGDGLAARAALEWGSAG